MKKLFAIATSIAILASGSAFAKTQGSYVGLDLISIRTGYYQKNDTRIGFKKKKPIKYGSNFGVGYDINDVVAPYITVGYGVVNYEVQSNSFTQSGAISTAASSGTASNSLFVGSLKFTLSKNISLNLEYNYQKYSTKILYQQTLHTTLTKDSSLPKLI